MKNFPSRVQTTDLVTLVLKLCLPPCGNLNMLTIGTKMAKLDLIQLAKEVSDTPVLLYFAIKLESILAVHEVHLTLSSSPRM